MSDVAAGLFILLLICIGAIFFCVLLSTPPVSVHSQRRSIDWKSQPRDGKNRATTKSSDRAVSVAKPHIRNVQVTHRNARVPDTPIVKAQDPVVAIINKPTSCTRLTDYINRLIRHNGITYNTVFTIAIDSLLGMNIQYKDIQVISDAIEEAELFVVYALNLGKGSLEVEHGKYVGSTLRTLAIRMAEHWGFDNSRFPGAKVTKLNPPLSVHTLMTFETADEAREAEQIIYDGFESIYGSENVRGADFCWSLPGTREYLKTYHRVKRQCTIPDIEYKRQTVHIN